MGDKKILGKHGNRINKVYPIVPFEISNLNGKQGACQDGDAHTLMGRWVLTHIPIGAFPPESSQCVHRCGDGHAGERVAARHLHFPNQRILPGRHPSEC